MDIKLGCKARDVITGFDGVVIALMQHLTGCNQVCILPQTLDKDGKRRDGEWFDDSRIEVIADEAIKLKRTPEQVKRKLGFATVEAVLDSLAELERKYTTPSQSKK